MTVKEISELWNVSTKTVYSYCQKGYILGAYKKGKIWVIPDNYKQPYISHKKKFRSNCEKLNYVLMAFASGKQIDFRLLSISELEFKQYANLLSKDGYLIERDGFFEITASGLFRCETIKNRRKKEIIDGAKNIVECVSIVIQLLAKAT